jgi:hypothetical protein
MDLSKAANRSSAGAAFCDPLKELVGRSRYAAEKKSKIVYNSYNCPISGN